MVGAAIPPETKYTTKCIVIPRKLAIAIATRNAGLSQWRMACAR
jgi:hypothetical protein